MKSSPLRVLVTGAGGRLGSQIAAELSERSCVLALNDIDKKSLERACGRLDQGAAVAFAADVSDPAAADRLVREVLDRFGRLDVVVNAAGTEGQIAPVEQLSPASVRHVFDVNVMSMFWVCRSVVPGMKQRRRGRVINIASGAGLAGGALASAYHASKHAVVGLTRSLAKELGPHEIAVNAVCPGYVDSPMLQRILSQKQAATGSRPDVAASVPMGRKAEPGEVASTVAYLALDAPLYMTGASIVLDGALRA